MSLFFQRLRISQTEVLLHLRITVLILISARLRFYFQPHISDWFVNQTVLTLDWSCLNIFLSLFEIFKGLSHFLLFETLEGLIFLFFLVVFLSYFFSSHVNNMLNILILNLLLLQLILPITFFIKLINFHYLLKHIILFLRCQRTLFPWLLWCTHCIPFMLHQIFLLLLVYAKCYFVLDFRFVDHELSKLEVYSSFVDSLFEIIFNFVISISSNCLNLAESWDFKLALILNLVFKLRVVVLHPCFYFLDFVG